MKNKKYCMSHYLAFRFIKDENGLMLRFMKSILEEEKAKGLGLD